MHEALSNQQVHINKAGINAHLPTRTSMLAAGNPKYGRFDPNREIAEQIELGPTILSRFDLMFMVTDNPDRDSDEPVIEGMIDNRQAAARYTENQHQISDDELEEIEPAVDAEVLRAWVAYARQNITPTIEDDDVAAQLKESFADLRMVNGDDQDAPVPVTFRKLEGIMRLAEASAKLRLSEEIKMEDVKRAEELVGRAMQDVGMDPESGQMDADVVETGMSKSQQDRTDWLFEFIATKGPEYDTGVPIDVVKDKAEEEGFSPGKVDYSIKKLKTKGELYEPKTDHLRATKK